MKMNVLWVVVPSSLIEVYRRLRDARCLHHQSDVISVSRFAKIWWSHAPTAWCSYSKTVMEYIHIRTR